MNENYSSSNLTNAQDLLISLGYDDFDFIVYQFVMPCVGLIGLILCSLSIWIFFTYKEFEFKMYDYYRFLVIIYWIHLALSIPYALFFTPRYFQSINTYPWACYQIFYFTFSNFLCHVAGVIEIGILMDREAIFSRFVKTYYKLEPKTNCLIILFTCIVINLECMFVWQTSLAGYFYYIDNKTGQRIENAYYYGVITNFGLSGIGFALTIAIYFVRDFLTLIVGLVLNIISGIHLRNYYQTKRFKSKINNLNIAKSAVATTSTNCIISPAVSTDKTNNKAKLLPMIVMLCCISIVERVILLSCNIYYLIVINGATLVLGTLVDLTLMIGPAVSFFVFYFFNNHFNKTVSDLFKRREQRRM